MGTIERADGPFLPSGTLSFDIFCRVIDNFGDIGVCWRLARQLAATQEHYPVRLWVDDLRSFVKIEPAVDPALNSQTAQGVEIVHWTGDVPALLPYKVVIEAFACNPPAAFIDRMQEQESIWINLEYLSAEAWVESCHALPSVQPNGLHKSFFFPGFSNATGGLLRETALLRDRDAWLSQPHLRWQLLQQLGMPPELIQGLQTGWQQVFLFCYPSAPVHALAQALAEHPLPSVTIVPSGVYPGLKGLATGHVHVFETPFVEQARFDQLLWCSDLNFVRGEDSLVRALWAGKPLIWQIYEQEDETHLIKLQAWLAQSPYDQLIHELMIAWNTGDGTSFGHLLQNALTRPNFSRWQTDACAWAEKLSENSDLAASLIKFCAKNQRTG